MKVRIYKPARTAMQSGAANTRRWVMEFVAKPVKPIDPMLGWVGSDDTNQQVRMAFDSEAEAIEYAAKQGYEIERATPKAKTVKPKLYAANFAHNRIRTYPKPQLPSGKP